MCKVIFVVVVVVVSIIPTFCACTDSGRLPCVKLIKPAVPESIVHWKDWHDAGIVTITDLLDKNNMFLTFNKILLKKWPQSTLY